MCSEWHTICGKCLLLMLLNDIVHSLNDYLPGLTAMIGHGQKIENHINWMAPITIYSLTLYLDLMYDTLAHLCIIPCLCNLFALVCGISYNVHICHAENGLWSWWNWMIMNFLNIQFFNRVSSYDQRWEKCGIKSITEIGCSSHGGRCGALVAIHIGHICT